MLRIRLDLQPKKKKTFAQVLLLLNRKTFIYFRKMNNKKAAVTVLFNEIK